ncbi:aminopeptidase N [Aestuariispira insulae]|uniref:Aminopeptidase N n=1 Tax=Aestuariispira insulae TaxID=1461337 RepID=A0A3D9HEW4_9PROT|nr:aminopeptidase N [Aestuariispira insulae]RED48018.1 aminopeptidase N [Aestuariispira insulae]
MSADTNPPVIRLQDYTAPAYRLRHVEMVFDLDPESTLVTTTMAVTRLAGMEVPLELDGDRDMALVSVWLDNRELPDGRYELTEESLTLRDLPEEFELQIQTSINPKANTKLEGLYQSNGMFCTQCEAEGFRRITFFPDRPDVMTTYRVTIRAPKADYPVLLSNGNNVENGDLPDGRHYAVWDDPFPKPSYLFALVAGDLAMMEDRFTTMGDRDVTLRIFVEHGNESRCAYAMDSLIRSMKWDEERFGLEYDLDIFNIVAVSDFNMGAMENKSLNIFNAKYILADPETATDADFALVEGIVAHEYFHNWTGNRVTCRDWFQLSLKEGLTVFRDQEFSGDQRSHAVQRIEDVRMLRARQFPEDAGPLSHPVRPDSYIEINNFYTATVYEKGAEVIRMMHSILGEDGFQRGMKLYFERHDGQAVTCDDFTAAMSDANDMDLSHFKLWYSQSGTPLVTVSEHYDETAKTFRIRVRQETRPTPGQEKKQPLYIPLRTALIGQDGQDLSCRFDGVEAREHVLTLTKAEQDFVFEGVGEKPILSINRGFSAPVILKSDAGHPEKAFQMAHDADPFNRWNAGQDYGVSLILEMVETLQNGGKPDVDPAFLDAMGRIARDQAIDPAFKALALTLPSEDYVAEQMQVVDVEAIHGAREHLRRAIGTAHRDQFQHLYETHRLEDGRFDPGAEAAGHRALRSVALGYLGSADGDTAAPVLKSHFDQADNMTDAMAALRYLTDMDVPERASCLTAFEERWKGNQQVMDKWFGIQAMSARQNTLDDVRGLMEHPAFTMKNPNRVRSLIGAFCIGNPLHFHVQDGSGYDFLAEQVIALDKINPQVAARLMGPLGQWRRFDSGHQEKMKAAISHVLESGELSKDVYEIASKSLAG